LIGRSEIFFKWLLYSAASLLLLLLQGAVLQRLRLFGVMPFLYPVLAAVLSMCEGALSGTVYSLALGVICDLVLPGPIPCFYTLIFPLAGLCSGLVSRSWLPAGFLCSLVVSFMAFVLTDTFHGLLLVLAGKTAWAAVAMTALCEICATALFVPLVFLLFRRICRKCAADF